MVDDTTIKVNIAAKFINAGNNLFVNINTSILEGRVLLTGLVNNQKFELKPLDLCGRFEAVKEVINEIEIGNRSGLKDYASDLWINTQARGVAAKTVGLRSVGYNFETIQGKLYVAGITSNPEQLGSLIEALKTIKGVKEIVNYVIVVEASS